MEGGATFHTEHKSNIGGMSLVENMAGMLREGCVKRRATAREEAQATEWKSEAQLKCEANKMSDEGDYVVEYTDDRPETTNYIKREGTVKITYRNGDSYEGPIGAEKLKQGEGKYVWRQKTEDGEVKDVASYEGTYVNSIKHGLGKMVFPSGDTYHGEWKQDKMHGDGSYMYANGDIFSGKFENGIRVGKGTYEFASDKSLLVGNWADNIITDGKWIFKDGGSYVGRFENGKPIGSCMYKFPSGLQQDGEYVKAQETNAAGEDVTTHKFIGSTIVRVR